MMNENLNPMFKKILNSQLDIRGINSSSDSSLQKQECYKTSSPCEYCCSGLCKEGC